MNKEALEKLLDRTKLPWDETAKILSDLIELLMEDETNKHCEHVFDTSMNDHTHRCCKCGERPTQNPLTIEEKIKYIESIVGKDGMKEMAEEMIDKIQEIYSTKT